MVRKRLLVIRDAMNDIKYVVLGNGHGSHCAGTIAGRRFGVAKEAQPVAVKVLRSNGSGSMSGVLAGVNWALEQHQMDAEEARASNKTYKGAVANMSLGGGRSKALNMAVNEVYTCYLPARHLFTHVLMRTGCTERYCVCSSSRQR